MWTTEETKRYEEHLKKYWTQGGEKIPQPLRPSVQLTPRQYLTAMRSMRNKAKETYKLHTSLFDALMK